MAVENSVLRSPRAGFYDVCKAKADAFVTRGLSIKELAYGESKEG